MEKGGEIFKNLQSWALYYLVPKGKCKQEKYLINLK